MLRLDMGWFDVENALVLPARLKEDMINVTAVWKNFEFIYVKESSNIALMIMPDILNFPMGIEKIQILEVLSKFP